VKASLDALYVTLLEDLEVWRPSKAPEATPTQFAAAHMLEAFPKKFRDAPDCFAEDRARDKFFSINERCRTFEIKPCRLIEDYFLGELKHSLWKLFDHDSWFPTYPSILIGGYSGPGSSVGARGEDFYTKFFDSPLTTTRPFLYDVFKRHVEHYPTWKSANDRRRNVHAESLTVECNRLTFVPKTNEIARTICVEPSLNMFFQLGLGALITEQLKTLRCLPR